MIDYKKLKTAMRKIFAIFIGFFAILFHIQQASTASLYELFLIYPIGLVVCCFGTYFIYKGFK